MAIWLLLLLSYAIFPLYSSAISTTNKITPGFPSSKFIQPEQQPTKTNITSKLYKEKFFTQILDHFNYNPQSYQKFQQRYLINDKYWGGSSNNNSPIFVYTGNEGDIEWFAQNTGFMFETAPYFKALLVFIEVLWEVHALWGSKEIAYSNSTTLGYLSSTQALADYATLILDLKNNLSATHSPVVVFGGSYGGMLAAWFRLKYPHVAVGALASSAPILNFDNITSHLVSTISSPKTSGNYISAGSLSNWLGTAYTYTAMTDYPTPTNFLNPLPAYPVKQMCKAIDDPATGNNTFEKLYGAANIYYNYTGEAKCFDLVDDSDPHGLGGWTWQACTEMILLTDGNTEDSIFPASNYSYNDRLEFCKSNFNIEPRPSWIPTEFGAQHIHRVLKRFGSNIIFFNGLRDPWSGGGVLKDISKSVIAIVAKEGAHHVDLRFSTSEDPGWLQDVRKREVNIISKWLSQYYHTLIDSPNS
ncbi:hypothetical protein DH2020_018161 [Rehmannia glutinosa]|uniref:Lysosomal Pro-X carboxypeptidase-like protein n=1 Tax=Rehmannia glutinosa TaxID=99300 RepID=A0ABR0WJI1_REHGL